MSTLDQIVEPLSSDLRATGLFQDGELGKLVGHLGGFPALPHHRLFLEWRLGSELVLEGYGHGYERAALTALLDSGVDFAAAAPLVAAKAMDPFAEDRWRYLDLDADPDPDWIEYDYAD